MQKRRYGEKRTGGYVDMGKQVREHVFWCGLAKFDAIFGIVPRRIYPRNTYEKSSKTTEI